MVRLIVIAALCATTVDVLWFLLLSRYNRRKGVLVLRWVEAACAARGRVMQVLVVLAVLAFSGLQNMLLLTNFNQEASGIVTGALLLASVFVPNAARWLRRLPGRLPPAPRPRPQGGQP